MCSYSIELVSANCCMNAFTFSLTWKEKQMYFQSKDSLSSLQWSLCYLIFKEFVFQGLFSRVCPSSFKALLIILNWTKAMTILTDTMLDGFLIYRIVFCNTSDLVIIISPGQSLQSIWIKFSTRGIKLLPVILCQFSPKWIDGNDECATISFKLKLQTNCTTLGTNSIQFWYHLQPRFRTWHPRFLPQYFYKNCKMIPNKICTGCFE